MYKLLILVFLPLSSFSFAAGQITGNKITSVSFNTGGFFLNSPSWDNPNNCTRSNAIVLQSTDPNYDKAFAVLLAAYLSGKKVSGYSDKCVEHDGQTYNMIRGFKYLKISE